MPDEKNADKSASWLPNLNHLLLILVAGTVLISQVPYHDSRPAKPPASLSATHEAEARLWQDPFEAVKAHMDKFEPAKESDKEKKDDNMTPDIGGQIADKIAINQLTGLNVVAVMMPGSPYFEDGESRRRIRYAVLSGFNAALRYMPANNNHIGYYTTNKNTLAFEWMVYKPAEPYLPPKSAKQPDLNKCLDSDSDKDGAAEFYKDCDRVYERPPVLVLWLDEEQFKSAPDAKLKKLLDQIGNQKSSESKPKNPPDQAQNKPPLTTHPNHIAWNVTVIGPFDSDNLQDLANEAEAPPPKQNPEYIKISYLSASATLQDKNVLKPLEDLNEKQPPPENKEHPLRQSEAQSLPLHFSNHGIAFTRVTATDDDLAKTIAKELALRGVAPSEDNRVVLIGEWDTLYGWHLPNTFASELVHGEGANCRTGKIENNNNSTTSGAADYQDWDKIYPTSTQCIFKFSYLRGLNGEKSTATHHANQTDTGNKNSAGDGNLNKKLEDADDDSQFDYVRRMVGKIERLDQELRQSIFNPTAHAIKAIGILGSDVYDKLLIIQALHDSFPDAVMFTNGVDARFLHPDQNKWTRNLLMVSGFGLELERALQRDIPPFRDSVQTAFFLTTEMAVAGLEYPPGKDADSKKKEENRHACLLDNPDNPRLCAQLTAAKASDDFKKILGNPKVYEVGRTRIFPLPAPDGRPFDKACESDNLQCLLHLQAAEPNTKRLKLLLVCLMLLSLVSVAFPTARRFFGTEPGFHFAKIMLGFTGAAIILVLAWPPLLAKMTISLDTPASNLAIHSLNISSFLFAVAYVYVIFSLLINIDPAEALQPMPRCFLKTSACVILMLSLLLLVTVTILPYSEEPMSLFEGVSMWPSEGMRFFSLLLAGYLIIDAYRCSAGFENWLREHFERYLGALPLPVEQRYIDRLFKPENRHRKGRNLLQEWVSWSDKSARLARVAIRTVFFFSFGFGIFLVLGSPHVPFRGEGIRLLDDVLLRGMLVPAFILLLFLVTDAAHFAANLIEQTYIENSSQRVFWPTKTCRGYANKFKLGQDDMHEWISMRFAHQLSAGVYRVIGYPMAVVLFMIVSRSRIFDNWVTSDALKIVIGLSVAYLLYCDFRLKKAVDKARQTALKSMRERAVAYKGDKHREGRGEQLERLISILETSDEMAYKSFTQRPIFLNSLLILAALLADTADFSVLASKLF